MLLLSSPQAQVTSSCKQSPGCPEFSILPSGVLSVAMETERQSPSCLLSCRRHLCCQWCLKLALESKAVHISSSDTMQRVLRPSKSQHGVCHTLSPIPVLYPDGATSLLGLSSGVSSSCKSTFNACCFCTHSYPVPRFRGQGMTTTQLWVQVY